MHPRLQQQIQQYIADPASLPEAWHKLLQAISETYVVLDEEQNQAAAAVAQLTQEMDVARQDRQQSISNLQAILDAFPDLFFRLDGAGTFLDYRSGTATQLYLPPEQFLNKKIHDTFSPAQADAFLHVIQQSLTTQNLVSYEYSLPIGGADQYFELRVIPISQAEVVAVIRDITARQLMETELRNQKALFENLVKVARMTSAQPDLEATLQNVLDVTTHLTKSERGNLFLLNPNGEVTHAIISQGTSFMGNPLQIAQQLIKNGLEGWVIQKREAILVQDTLQSDHWLNLSQTNDPFRSALAIPIFNGGLVSGVLTLLRREAGYFTEEHQRLMDAAAEQIALALRNAQIFEMQRQMTTRQFIMYELLRSTGEQHAPSQVMELAVNTIARLTEWSHVSISTPDQTGQEWIVRVATGQLAHRVGVTYSSTQGIIGRALRTQQMQYVPNVHTDPDYVVGQLKTQSELAVPIIREDRLLGILDIQSERLNDFTPDDLFMAESVTGAVALALDNARLYSDVESHLSEIRTLYSITQLATQSLVVEDVVAAALEATLQSLGYHKGLILLKNLDDDSLYIGAAHHLTPTFQNNLLHSEIADLCRRQHSTGSWSMIWPEAPPETLPVPETWAFTLRTEGIDSFACAPLRHQTEALGAFYLFDHQPDHALNVTPQLLMAIGHQIGVAVTNAYLHEDVAFKQSQLRTLIEASRNGVVLVTPDGDMPFVNAAAFDMFDFPGQPADWVNRPISQNLLRLRRHFPHIVKSLIAEIRRVVHGDESNQEGEWEIPNRVIQWSHVPVLDKDQFQGWLLITRDVTEERRLARLREDLTQTVIHDLRNPLTAIAGAIELIQLEAQEQSFDTLPQMLEIIEMNTGKMLALVNTIMDISRLESRQMPLRWTAFYLHDLVAEAFRLQAPLAEEKQIKLTYERPSEFLLLWADADLVARILQNLIGNAIKFIETEGIIRIAAALEPHTENNPSARITVWDNGPGIAPDIRDNLFQKFVTGRQKASGSGIGLSFCQLAVQAHGGRIWVESDPGQGTAFHFTLPIFQLDQPVN